jgi:hypothetical protein
MVNVKIIKTFILFILLFNIVDAFLTTKFIIELLILNENNPLMLYLIELDMGVLPFIIPKTLLVCFGCYLLWGRAENILAQMGAYLCFITYFVIVTHFYFFIVYLHY